MFILHEPINILGSELQGRWGDLYINFSKYKAFLIVPMALFLLPSCDDVDGSNVRGLGSKDSKKTSTTESESAPTVTSPSKSSIAYSDEDFVESERNRDPFRSFTTLFQATTPEKPQRRVVMPTTAIENMNLIAIISGVPAPKAMLVDASGVGHVVERGVYLGRPEVVRASENVSMTLNWRVHRIRENEVVLTREDPTDPSRPPLTRVIPLRDKELVASN